MTANRRLDTWKEIGFFLGRNERTAKRWELDRGLPVHRVPGGPRGRIYAYSDELTAWLANSPADAGVDDLTPKRPTAAPQRNGNVALLPSASTKVAIALGLAALLAVLTTAFWSVDSERLRSRRPSEIERLGDYEWSRRTPESLVRAVDAYTQAIVEDPNDARAYAGLARSYTLLREFSVLPDVIAYRKAEAAARRAIAIDDTLADAHATLGFVQFYSSWKFAAGLQEFRRAIELEPSNGTWRQWYANALSTLGNFPAARREIDRAQELTPSSPALMADRARIYFMSGDRAKALAMLRTLEQNEPNLTSSHTYLAQFLEETGDDRGYLRELAKAANLRHDPDLSSIAKAGERGFAAGQRRGMFAAIVSQREALLKIGKGEQFRLAESYAAAGDTPHAVAALQRALASREPTLLGIKTEGVFHDMAASPQYTAVVKAVGL